MIVDPDGMVWYSHFGEQFLSKLDPKTGKVTDFPIPVQKPNHPKGTLDLEIDEDGHIWVGLMYQTGVARFGPRQRKIPHLSAAQRVASGRHPAVALFGGGDEGGWQGLGQELRPFAGQVNGPRNRPVREPRDFP